MLNGWGVRDGVWDVECGTCFWLECCMWEVLEVYVGLLACRHEFIDTDKLGLGIVAP